MKSFLMKLDLQFFADAADDGGFGGYDPASAYEGIESAPIDVQPEGQGEYGEQMEPQGDPQESLLDFGGRRLPANEDLTGLHKDFTEQQRYITALQEQVNAYKQLAQAQPQAQQQVQPQSQPEVSSDVQNWDEETWQKFYDRPQDIIGNLVQSEIQKFASEKLDPILQERQWNNEIQGMYDRYPDFDQFIGEVQELVNTDERYVQEGGLEQAYFRAKATNGVANPAQLAQDPQFLEQYVLNNPQVQNQMVQQYFQQKQQTNAQIPVTMGRGAGGFTPQTPDASPQTLKEASRMFLKNLGVR